MPSTFIFALCYISALSHNHQHHHHFPSEITRQLGHEHKSLTKRKGVKKPRWITSSNDRFLENTWWNQDGEAHQFRRTRQPQFKIHNQELSPNYVGTWRSKTTTEHENHTSVFCNARHHHLPRDNSGVWNLFSLMNFAYNNPQQPLPRGLLKCAVHGPKYYRWAKRESYYRHVSCAIPYETEPSASRI